MTKKRNTQNGTVAMPMVGLVNGSMAVVKKAAKVKNIQRHRFFMNRQSELVSSEQVLSGTQSPYPVGSQFSAGTLLFAAVEFTDNAISWIQSHDVYRMAEVEVFVTLVSRSKTGGIDRSLPVELYFYEDTDAEPVTQTSWLRTADRDNLGRVVLTVLQPSQRLITFRPTVTLAAGAIDQNPSNIVPGKNQWLDALAIQQLYSGLRWFSCCAQTDTQGQTYDYSLAFTYRAKIEAKQPI